MDASIQTIIERSASDSHAGAITFGAAVAALMQAGVESYHADYRRRCATYYLPSGATHQVPLQAPDVAIPLPFSADALQAAIRGAQRDEVRYPEFMRLSMLAGCVGYIVWIAGRHVTYFGHCGELHVEPFPSAA